MPRLKSTSRAIETQLVDDARQHRGGEFLAYVEGKPFASLAQIDDQ